MFHRKWLYHKDLGSVLVETEEQEKELGKGYSDHPVEQTEEAPVPEQAHKEEHKAPKKKGHK